MMAVRVSLGESKKVLKLRWQWGIEESIVNIKKSEMLIGCYE